MWRNYYRKAWKLGQSPALQPRIIHDIESIVVLISAQYICCNNHIYLTTDPRVLQRISEIYIPFTLLHKTGFLKSFVNQVIGLIREGLNICAIERYIRSQRRATIAGLTNQVAELFIIFNLS